MGNFYVNHVVVEADHDEVLAELRRIGRGGYCSETVGGNVYVYDNESESQDENVIERLAVELSRLKCRSVFAFLNHDDDVLVIWVARDGEIVDRFNSCPDYFSEQMPETPTPTGGDPAVMADAAGVPERADDVAKVLGERDPFAIFQHQGLAEALGFEPEFCLIGANAFPRGEASGEVDEVTVVI